MNIKSLKHKWKSDIKTFNRLFKKQKEFNNINDYILELRNDILDKMKDKDINDDDYQNHLIELINNVVWERTIKLDNTKNTLEMCFTPDFRKQLDGDDK